MKTFLIIIGTFCLVLFFWALLSIGRVPDYNAQVSAESIQAILANRGLQVCERNNFDLDQAPGFVEGKTIKVSTNCAMDTNPMRVSLLRFDSETSRNTAMQRAATAHRNGFGPHLAYTYGPYVITVQGTRGIAHQALFTKALNEAGARQ
jgi:hypothetical protein